MLLKNKNIILLLVIYSLVFVFVFLFIKHGNFIDISKLGYIVYLSTGMLICTFIISIFMVNNKTIGRFIYSVLACVLILFFIMTVFVLNVEDIFYWHPDKKQNQYFFKFSNLVVEINYLLFFPYALFAISEILLLSFGLINNKRKNKE